MARSPVSRPELKGSPAAKAATATARRGSAQPEPPREGYRETVEAIVVAFMLALLVRGYEAEAFVIPTGSMAPTLMGRHKEITCPECGYVYSVNASDEVEGAFGGNRRVYSGICGNCRFQARVDGEPSFKGDRILVMKFPYDLPNLPLSTPPRRFDVVVFRYPEEPEVSYIKRLIGLPGETLRIWYGDVFIKPPGGTEFEQIRKPLAHQKAMQMMVYDDAHRAALLKDRPEWARWNAATEGAWKIDAEGPGTYVAAPAGDDWAELRYRHLVPDPAQWRAIEAGDTLPHPARATLITDFYSYNTNLNEHNSDLTGETTHDQESVWKQADWVGDLSITAHVATDGAAGAVRFELIEGGVVNRCEVDLASGEAALWHGEAELGRAATPLKGAGAHEVHFANIDNRLTLLVDNRPIFGDGLTYQDEPGQHPLPTAEDLAPVRIAARSAKVRLSGLVVKRDIYYTLEPGVSDYFTGGWGTSRPRGPVELFNMLADPAQIAALGPLRVSDEYPIGADRFMMLGDNSPRSKDSRGWGNLDRRWDPAGREKWEVPRSMLTGKAFCVYWPHGKPFGPNYPISQDFRIPFRPYFERMKWIH